MFTHTVFAWFLSVIFFTYFNVMCKQHHRNSFNTFLNGEKNGVKNVTCKPGFSLHPLLAELRWAYLVGPLHIYTYSLLLQASTVVQNGHM